MNGQAGTRLLGLADTLDTHAGFADVVAALREGHGGTIGGTWGSACALAVAGLARALGHGAAGPRPAAPLVVVLPHAAEAEAFADDLALFTTTPAALLPALEDFAFAEAAATDDTHGVFAGGSAAPDPVEADRLSLVKRLTGEDPPAVIVTSIQALLAPLADPRDVAAGTRRLEVGGRLDPEELADWLAARGWTAADAIDVPGSFARRGGIVDLFAADWERPVRVELDGDEIDSLRTFDTVSQRSVAALEHVDVTALAASAGARRRTHLADLVPPGTIWAIAEPGEVAEEARRMHERLADTSAGLFAPDDVLARINRFASVALSALAPSSLDAAATLAIESVERFTGVLDRVREELDTVGRDQEVWVVCPSDAEEKRLAELLASSAPARTGRLRFARGRLSAGFRLVPEKLVLVGSAELFNRDEAAARPQKQRLSRAIDTFLDLHEGDHVVHVAHGIGRYRGLKLLEQHGRTEEFLEIEFAESTKIFVPASCIELVQKYVGGTKLAPKLAKIGGTLWAKQKAAVERAVADMAADMIRLQATRASRPGIAFPADTAWQRQFEESFPFDETPDQLTAMEAIRGDMEQAKPMDRLLCGDVGFGKTELAMRAAFKAAEAGAQVAVLVPTTVLAEQHRRTFTARFAEFPFVIRSLSRLSGTAETRDTLEGLARKSVDIVIGTHRLAQSDIHFANLGLVIVDEEQRFGVDVKERLKALRSSVDVLTMTATPIPRTLHMSMLGIRDISNLTTPPVNRIPVETKVARWDTALVRHAIEREFARDGQVFFVHNRIHDIHRVADRLRAIVPEATIGIAHGRLSETDLEDVMLGFVRGEIDILLATTIVESGLDIPRANTIFIDEADTYGLADLHQLRGRVGRSHHRAWCYLLVDEAARLTSTAAKRLRAIQEFSSMGAGFSLAMRDLEIRGAGNLLGTQQSGHIATVGYELYCRLLEQAVRGLKAMPPAEPPPVAIDLPGEAWLPRDYIPDFRAKVDVYRRLSRAAAATQIDDLASELTDRFGPLPPEAARLLDFARLRVAAAGLGIDSITRHPGMVMFGHHDRAAMERLRTAATKKGRTLRIVDQKTAVLPLRPETLANPDSLQASVHSLLALG
ncbi:MAG TPA: transcription-repair coupling factor [Planctomycetaceae bacterium]|nr:transcription-repair coupling factor [Planctomycetaceae bacterium]